MREIQKIRLLAVAATGAFLVSSAVAADNFADQKALGKAVVTVLPHQETASALSPDDVHVKIDGKDSDVTAFTALHSPSSQIETVIMIDDGARTSLALQLNDVAKFIRELPAGARVAVAYMEYGRAALAGPMTTDHEAVVRQLHVPLNGVPGMSGSSYFCLSDLARHWPSNDPHARREVVMITDGVDEYAPHYNPQDPYVQAAITDAVRAHLVVYSIYWRDEGRFDRSGYAAMDGQNLLAELTQAVGGDSYWQGFGNPVTLAPYFEDIGRRIHNQYELDFEAPIKARNGKNDVASLRLNLRSPGKVTAPQLVYLHPAGE